MKNFDVIRYLCRTLFAMACICGCVREEGSSVTQEKIVPMLFQPVDMPVCGIGTKAVDGTVDEGTGEGYEVSDFWFFEYDENGALLGAPRYYTTDDFDFTESVPVSVILPASAGLSYKVVIVANTHDPSLLSSISYTSLGALKSSSFPVASSDDLYQGSDLLMNAVSELSSSTSEIACMLHRNVAKLSVTINNVESSGINIRSVGLKNVPDRLFLADRLYADQVTAPDETAVNFRSIDDDILDLDEGGSRSLLYYLPRNMRGTNSSTTEAGKNVDAPENATYLEIIGRRKATQSLVAYKFYLGANNVNDFNIEANCHYSVTLNFTMYGDNNDNRVEDLSVVRLEDSNSYMINPKVGIRYSVPIENRINTFWKSPLGRQHGGSDDYLVGLASPWVAEVVWQDVDKNVIRFCGEDGSLKDRYDGASDDRFFNFVIEYETPCNIVIGVRRAGDDWSASKEGYMWTWHFWLTNYDPYEDVGNVVSDKYIYPVPGGNLHRYSSFEDIPAYRGRDVFIMDRNFGAEGSTREDGWQSCTGMLYQYGRKDPFPASDNVYDINGGPKSLTKTVGPFNIYRSVMYPADFILQSGDKEGDWATANVFLPYDWNDVGQNAMGGNGKSFFDPCPPGWKLPYNNIWLDFGNREKANASNWNDLNESSNQFESNLPGAGWLIYLDGTGSSGETAYFPASGMRNYSSGKYSGGSIGTFWSSKPNGSNGTYLYYENKMNYFWLPSQTFYRHMGLPVRCITE